MLTRVDADGRAVAVAGDPDHPITAGFLCGKVSNYLDRVYAEDRVLHPLIRERRRRARASSGGRAGTRRSTPPPRAAARRSSAHGGESVLPYSYMGTQGCLQGGSMAHRLMNALGASELVRTICATRRHRRRRSRRTALSPEVDPERVAARALRARLGLEPDVDGAAPVAQAARGAAQRRAAVRRRPLPQPHRAGGRRAPAAAARHRRRARAGDDARGRRRRAAPTRSGAAPTPTATTSCSARLGEHPVEHWAEICGVPAETIAADRRASSRPRSRAAAPRRRRPAPPRRADRLPHDRLPAGAGGRLAPRRRRLLVHPDGDRERRRARSLERRRAAARAGAPDQHVAARRGADRPELEPPVKALVVWTSNPAQIAPDQERGAARDFGARTSSRVVIEQFMTDTAALRRRGAAGDDPARAPRRRVLLGPPLLHLNEPAIEPLGEAKPNTETFRLLAARMGLERPARSPRPTRTCSRSCCAARPAACRSSRCASAAG